MCQWPHVLCNMCVSGMCCESTWNIMISKNKKTLQESVRTLASHSVIITLADCTLVIHGIQEESEDGKIIIFLFDPFHISNNSSLISARQLFHLNIVFFWPVVIKRIYWIWNSYFCRDGKSWFTSQDQEEKGEAQVQKFFKQCNQSVMNLFAMLENTTTMSFILTLLTLL